MKDFRQFQPLSHVKEIDGLQSRDSIRKHVLQFNLSMLEVESHVPVSAYDDAINAAAEFRLAHTDHISTYILNKIPGSVPVTAVTGTGGTPISAYLCRSALGTLDSRLRPLQAMSVALPTLCDLQCQLDM